MVVVSMTSPYVVDPYLNDINVIRDQKMSFHDLWLFIETLTVLHTDFSFAIILLQLESSSRYIIREPRIKPFHNELKRGKSPFWQDNTLFASKAKIKFKKKKNFDWRVASKAKLNIF